MENGRLKNLFILLTLIGTVLACNLPAAGNATEISPVVTEIPPPTEIPTEIPIQHQVIPIDLPAERSSHAGDYDSSTTAGKKVAAGGDRFTFGRFERPFNAETMDVYFSQLDIVDTFVYQDDTWIFGKIILNKLESSNALGNKYAIELDNDLDGKGDWLVIAANPASTDWLVDGVSVYEDANNNVGDVSAMFTDEHASGDGYETIVGNDPDAAWARISPEDPRTIEIAVKRSLLGNTEKYLINMWAGTSLLDPALFDINDHFTHEQAGAADAGLEFFYPIKEVYEIDNSCKMAVGFEPKGDEPGLCEVFIPYVPGAPPPPGQPTCPNSCEWGQEPYPNCTCWPG
jgi:hypothetical protein